MNQDNNTFIPNNPNVAAPNMGTPGVQPGMPQVQPGVVSVASTGQAAPTVSAQVATPAVPQVDPAVVSNTAVSTNPNILICSKCGSEMKKESRYCMKCGNLNYAHPDNESMKQYAWQSIKQGHFISGANLDDKQPLSMTNANSKSVSNANPFRACVITNIVLHVLLVVGMLFLFNMPFSLIGESLPISIIIGVVGGVLIGFILNYSVQAMYIKAGEPWWGYYVPIYNNYIMFKIAMGNGWIFLTSLIPIVGFIIALIALYNLGKKFYKSGWLTLFFPFIMIPIIGLDKNSEYSLLARTTTLGSTQVDAKGKTQSEREYGRNKFFITALIVIIVAVVLYFAWPYLVPIFNKVWELMQETISMFK